MKIAKTMTFSILAIIATGLLMTTPAAFADHSEVTIEAVLGSGAPGCEETAEGCYIPSTATVDVGGVVIMSNPDTAAHTFTAGSPADGPTGEFDTGLVMAGNSFEWSPDTVGEVPYFCMVHPWMVGLIVVQEAEAEEETHEEEMMEETHEEEMMEETHEEEMMETQEDIYVTLDHDISGGSVTEMEIEMDSNSLVIEVDATDNGSISVTLPRDVIDATNNGNDDDFFVIVDGEEVDFQETKTSTDRTLTVEFPAGAEEIEIIGTFVVPEFGTIAAMILAVAIISIIAVSAKSRLSIMPRL
ncbi:MAG: PEFG-CTERM sorting domain-containing protein [Nitrosopumilus sp.]|nr:PEFG-CTERM sorting domain-containing protein [Nitrosopumilus sp.]MDH3737034.1 PEFG-CTERM sorting domain-containing protein [Nitrosopumilus sp.]MDH3823821.1 PEFG-CTERM sorting domain-containing protein [Nitrosopumilus sp.]MDH3834384.1 PEFG-CTERM sorting domain-containing protein [Nitrosopumilus sp.]